MFNIGAGELLVILLVALLILGPAKLPEAARQVGRVVAELRRMSAGFQAEMRDALAEPVETVRRSPTPLAPTAAPVVSPEGESAGDHDPTGDDTGPTGGPGVAGDPDQSDDGGGTDGGTTA